jgi:putative NADH-flavin reductase
MPSNIVLVGATGNIGRCILDEALARQHQVTAVTRDAAKLATARPGMTVRQGNTADVAAMAAILKGHDAVVASVRWNDADIHQVIEAARQSGVKRALFVVGAGSLLRADGRTHLEHMTEAGNVPPTSRPASQALGVIRTVTDLDWTAISPPSSIQSGARTGKFRLGGDRLLEDAEGKSRISREDFAIAIVDEIEKPQHRGKRFTAAY